MSEGVDLRELDSVYALAASGGTLYAGRTSGLYHSSDGGREWHQVYASLELLNPLPTIAVVACPDGTVFAGFHEGILRSGDGCTWTAALRSDQRPKVVALVASPNYANDGLVLAGTEDDGVLVSSDRGESWYPWNFGLLDFNVLTLATSPSFAVDRIVYAGTETGLYRSENGGRAWHAVATLGDVGPVLSVAVLTGIHETNIVLVGTETKGLYLSSDSGGSWRHLELSRLEDPVNSIAGSATAIWVLCPQRVWVSRDGGASWLTHTILDKGVGLTLHADQAYLLVGFSEGGVGRYAV